jgi:hypothetical protein
MPISEKELVEKWAKERISDFNLRTHLEDI